MKIAFENCKDCKCESVKHEGNIEPDPNEEMRHESNNGDKAREADEAKENRGGARDQAPLDSYSRYLARLTPRTRTR